ncbi:MAG: hypothetical protein AVDCRST_MAG26-1474 [uncultured Chloroflexia bacterium]|uniref:Uncharacterized protein n=1 Tax=uncultured Chloroflexia bacterium TaxID=1672391 RepID=A0A6J4I6H3_9CHLR|nr:MAG: hypothetical protein AVDCRST_MAG26-1474 [uncultured Chloroflexia bacterium]
MFAPLFSGHGGDNPMQAGAARHDIRFVITLGPCCYLCSPAREGREHLA